MTIQEAIRARHSVRAYQNRAIEPAAAEALDEMIREINRESGLHIQLVRSEPKAFSGALAHYGHFSGVNDYIAMIGPKGPELDERCGYYGEQLVLRAQMLGLNSCWVQLTYRKVPGAFQIAPGEKLVVVIALGYGSTQGEPHRSKPLEQLCRSEGETPDWFRAGMEAVLLAPTAVNQQRFLFTRSGDTVQAKALLGPCSKIDLGIVKLHFEIGAGADNFRWI